MSDPILAELQEEVRREQMKQMMTRYGGYIIGVALLLVLGTGAYSFYSYQREEKLQEVTADLYAGLGPNALAAPKESAEKLKEFSAKHPDSDQVQLAALLEAGLRSRATDPQGALTSLKTVADNQKADKSLKAVASLLYVQNALDGETPVAELEPYLSSYTAADSDFRFLAWELAALAALKGGDHDKARGFVTQLLNDSATPVASRQRAEELQRVL